MKSDLDLKTRSSSLHFRRVRRALSRATHALAALPIAAPAHTPRTEHVQAASAPSNHLAEAFLAAFDGIVTRLFADAQVVPEIVAPIRAARVQGCVLRLGAK